MSLLAPRTPADFLRLGYQLTCHCESWPGPCRHSGEVSFDAVAVHLGDDFDIYAERDQLLWRLVCSICGSRRPATILSRVSPVATGPLPHPPIARELVPIDEAVRRSLALSAQARERDVAMGYDPPRGRRVRRFGRS
jgi:hypothetical protein